ncbi:MAG: hypothetical protein K0R83_392 [Caulobacter sp.]|jgi:hypothetical protein|nr:hypothetical protein [Caulobacter sp.]
MRTALVGAMMLLGACAPRYVGPGFIDDVCETRIPARIEGVATVEGRPALAAPVAETGRGHFAGRALRQGVSGAVTLFCSRSAAGINQCVLGPYVDWNYGFDKWAMSTVPDLDIPSRPDGLPVRVEFAFTVTQLYKSTCDR